MGFPVFFIIVLLVVLLLVATLAVYLHIYKVRINKTLNSNGSSAALPSPYKVAIILTIATLLIGIFASYFCGYKVAYDRVEQNAVSLTPFDLQTFYAEVIDVGDTTLTVEGVSINEQKYQGTMQYEVYAETSIIHNSKLITLSDLKQGDIVSITFLTAGGGITDIFKIQLINVKQQNITVITEPDA